VNNNVLTPNNFGQVGKAYKLRAVSRTVSSSSDVNLIFKLESVDKFCPRIVVLLSINESFVKVHKVNDSKWDLPKSEYCRTELM